MVYHIINKEVVEFGKLNRSINNPFDIKDDVYYADFNWDNVMELVSHNKLRYEEIPKYPSIRRDLALLVNKNIQFSEIKKLAYKSAEKNLLKKINLFDIYEGENIEKGKKSYAVSFLFQNPAKTLTDKEVDKIMEKLMNSFEKNLKAVIR